MKENEKCNRKREEIWKKRQRKNGVINIYGYVVSVEDKGGGEEGDRTKEKKK